VGDEQHRRVGADGQVTGAVRVYSIERCEACHCTHQTKQKKSKKTTSKTLKKWDIKQREKKNNRG
ncbi:hypothetical protein, partial [Pseudomonas marginalis]|uniref:hypothetical protein n=1 Tax=Pseudomonas marginalis TaxID=298 RepID=UPI0034D6E7B0